MISGYMRFFIVFALSLSLSLLALGQNAPQNGGDFSTNVHPTEKQKVPEGVIIVKGAWSSASDSVTPVPEGYKMTDNAFHDEYFGVTYPLPKDWREKRTGPPPSDSGLYMLSLITPADTYKGTRGSIAIMAQDMFFTPLPASNALELIKYRKNTLQSDYKVEMKPTETKMAGHLFTFFAYWSPAAEIHWYVVATEIRCHTLQILLTSRDTKLLESLFLDMNNMKLPADADATAGTGGGSVPVCIKDYAREENVIERVEPVFSERRFNAVPVRIIIDKQGKVKHIHFLSAFPEQEKAITDALKQWRFRPHLVNGQPVEVETGIMFGRAPRPTLPTTSTSSPANE
ncbi:MAG TPA: energy transducer TonB [Candidatus Angelobacter sp.]